MHESQTGRNRHRTKRIESVTILLVNYKRRMCVNRLFIPYRSALGVIEPRNRIADGKSIRNTNILIGCIGIDNVIRFICVIEDDHHCQSLNGELYYDARRGRRGSEGGDFNNGGGTREDSIKKGGHGENRLRVDQHRRQQIQFF